MTSSKFSRTLLGATFCLALFVSTAPANSPLRLMSFNIRFGTADDGDNRWENRRDLLTETIRKFDPDILGLQEALASQCAELRAAFPEYDFFGVGRDDGANAGEFVPILFRRAAFQKLDGGHFWLSETSDKPGVKGWDAACARMVTWVRLAPAGDAKRAFIVANTHFDHVGERARLESARQIRAWLDTRGATPAIVMGDFNCDPASAPFAALSGTASSGRSLLDTLAKCDAAEARAGTFHGFKGKDDGRRIDWILTTPEFTPLKATIDRTQRDGRYPSDHFAITATVQLAPATTSAPASQAARPNADPARWADAIRKFREFDERNTLPKLPALFVGSSSIVNWPTATTFSNIPIINRGFGGSHYSDLNHYYDDVVKKYAPRAIVVYSGDNDIADGKTAERVRDDFREFVLRVRADQPKVPIVVISIKPSRARWNHWPEMQRANELISKDCNQREQLYFLNLAPLMLKDGEPDDSFYLPDQLHLSDRGYLLWSTKLKPGLHKFMK